MPPNNESACHHVHFFDQALAETLEGVEVIMLGDFNVWLRDLTGKHEEELETEFVDSGLVDMTSHFLHQRLYRENRHCKCTMWQERWQVMEHIDYVPSTDRHTFINVVMMGGTSQHGSPENIFSATRREGAKKPLL